MKHGATHRKRDTGKGASISPALGDANDRPNAMEGFAGVVDQDGRLQFVTRSPLAKFGCSLEDLLGKPFWDAKWFHGSMGSQVAVKDSITRALDGETVLCETKAFANDGNPLTVTFDIRPLEGQGENVISIIAGVKPVAVQTSVKIDCEHTMQQQLHLLNYVSDAAIIVQDRLVKFANQRMAQILGCDADELINRDYLSFVPPHAMEDVAERHERKMAGEDITDTYEVEFINTKGQFVAIRSNDVLIDYEGQPAHMVILKDVTEIKQSERTSEEYIQSYRSLLDKSNDGIMVIRDTQVVFANKKITDMMGYTIGDIDLLTVRDPTAPCGYGKLPIVEYQFLERIAKEESETAYELDFVRGNGTVFPADVNSSVVDWWGESARIIVVRDITENRWAEASYKELEVRYKALFNNPLQMISVHDDEGRFIDANSYAFTKLDCTRDDIGKVMLQDIVHPDDLQEALQVMAAAWRTGRMEYPAELRLVSKTGTQFWVEIFGLPLISENGHFIGMSIARDITEQKQAMLELKESEERYRSLFTSMLDVYFEIDPSDMSISAINPAGVELLGYRLKEDVVGKKMWDLFDDPEQVMSLATMAMQDAKEGKNIRRLELSAKPKLGKTLVVEVVPHFTFDNEGSLIAMDGIMRDITERKQIEDSLRQSEERFRSLFEAIEDVYFRVDKGFHVMAMNPAGLKLLEFRSQDEVIGRDLFSLFQEGTQAADKAEDLFRNAGTSIYPEKQEIAVKTKSGALVIIEVSPHLIFDEERVLVGADGILRDITQRVRDREKLMESEAMLQKMVIQLKHSHKELSTPVIQIWDQILALPLIGMIDASRALSITTALLDKILDARAQVVILDLTGVTNMDTQVANNVFTTIQAANLLGSECVVTGINPEVAQTMIHLGMDMSEIHTVRDMQEGLEWGLQYVGCRISGKAIE